jgi:hypothetical protein
VVRTPPPPAIAGHLVVDAAGEWKRNQAGLERIPKVSINGQGLIALRKGPNVFPLPAGQYELIVGIGMEYTNSFHYGRAHIMVPVVPQRTTTVYYRAPYTTLSGGAIGMCPQSPPDTLQLGCVIAVVVVPIVFGLLIMLGLF